MNKLGGSDSSLQFDNESKHKNKIIFDYLKKKINRLYRMAFLFAKLISY